MLSYKHNSFSELGSLLKENIELPSGYYAFEKFPLPLILKFFIKKNFSRWLISESAEKQTILIRDFSGVLFK